MMINQKILLQILISSISISASKLKCKCIPTETCWPGLSAWAQFNSTLSGALIRATPPASVCYPDEANYNEEACARIRESWSDSLFHGSDPISIDYPVWTNNSCNPIYPNGTSVTGDPGAGERGCDASTYPAYVVNATRPDQVAKTLTWAAKTNIRVVVKATGHSYTGRSTGAASLSIWTHNFRGLEYIDDFHPASCSTTDPKSYTAVRVAAGHTGSEIQAFLDPYGQAVVTGANPSVGIVGWLTGGGHGFLSSTYGMGSDNLLEATIVLPIGSVIVANPFQNSDIFFAIRGGGGGTFGVITEVVLRTYPTPRTSRHVFTLGSLPEATDSQFWDAVGYLHSQMERLKQGGMAGYYYMVGPPIAPSLSLIWAFMLFDKPNGTVDTLMAPIETYLMERANLFVFSSNVTHGPTYFSIASQLQNEGVAGSGSTYGSRLLSPSSLSNSTLTARTLQSIGPSGNASQPNGLSITFLIGHMIGPYPFDTSLSYYPEVSSLNPAWRDTLSHLIVIGGWQDGAPVSHINAVYEEITAKTQVLRRLSPDTGAYFNEADSREVDWQESFFGENYERLLKVKRDVDPRNVLWCKKCVGSEALVEGDGGQLCGTRHKFEDDDSGTKSQKGRSELRP